MKYELSEQESVKLPFTRGVDLPTPGLPNMNSQSRNEILAVRAGICEIVIHQGGRSANTWSAKYELSEQKSIIAI